jgi:hypothetical protein
MNFARRQVHSKTYLNKAWNKKYENRLTHSMFPFLFFFDGNIVLCKLKEEVPQWLNSFDTKWGAGIRNILVVCSFFVEKKETTFWCLSKKSDFSWWLYQFFNYFSFTFLVGAQCFFPSEPISVVRVLGSKKTYLRQKMEKYDIKNDRQLLFLSSRTTKNTPCRQPGWDSISSTRNDRLKCFMRNIECLFTQEQ